MELADFPNLKDVGLEGTNVTGDIREISDDSFVALESLGVGDGVYGGGDFKRIHDAPAIMLARYRVKKRNPEIFSNRRWALAYDSPDRYEIQGHHSRAFPFHAEFVVAGTRIGWRWIL